MPADLREALDAAAPRHVPELDFDRLLRRHRRATALRAAMPVVVAVVVVAGIGLALAPGTVELWIDDLIGGSDEEAVPADDFVGAWEALDLDGSHLRMTIQARDDGTFEVEASDDSATACEGAPATMSGIGTLDGTARMSVTQVYRCEDGTVITEAGGIRLDEWYLDLGGGVLTDPTGVVWYPTPDAAPPPVAELDGLDGLDDIAVETTLGTWTWTWIPRGEGASRFWDVAYQRWEDEDQFPASIPDMSWATDEWWEDNWEWVAWNRVPWARASAVTIATFLGGSPTNPADTREDWHLVVDAGDGYELHEVPWHGLSIIDVDLAVQSDVLVAVALAGDLDPVDWNPSPDPPLLHRWGSADGVQWEQLGSPLAVGDARRLRLVGGDDRLLLRLDGPQPSLWTSPDAVSWQQVGPDRLNDWSEGPPARTSYAWVITNPQQTDLIEDLWRCEVWLSADTVSWEQVPFYQVVERQPMAASGDCRVFGNDVYVRVAEPSESRTAGLWIGRLDP